MLKTNLGLDKSRPIRKQVSTCFFHVEWSATSHHKGRETLGVGGVVSHFIDCAIHQRTNQIEVFGFFIVDKAQTSVNMLIHGVGAMISHYFLGEGDPRHDAHSSSEEESSF